MDHPISAPTFPAVAGKDDVPAENYEEIEIDKTVPLSEEEEGETVAGEEGDEAEWRISVDDDFEEEPITWGTLVQDSAKAKMPLADGSDTMAIAIKKLAPFVGVTGGTDDAVTLFDAVTMEQLDKSNEPNETINCLSWCYDESFVAAGSLASDSIGGQVFIYSLSEDAKKLVLSQTLEGPGGDVEWLSWHPKGYCIMAGFDDGSVWLWMTKSGNLFNILVGHGGNVTCGRFSQDGKLAITGSSDGGLIVWKLSSASIEFHLRPKQESFGTYQLDMFGGHSNAIICLDVHPFLPLVATGAEDNSVKIFNFETNRVIQTIAKFEDTVESIQWLPVAQDHCILAAASLDGSLRVWNGGLEWQMILTRFHDAPDSMEQNSKFKGGITALRWIIADNPGASYNEVVRDAIITTISLDGTVRLWAINSEFESRVIGGSDGALVAVDSTKVEGKAAIYCAGDEGIVRAYEI